MLKKFGWPRVTLTLGLAAGAVVSAWLGEVELGTTLGALAGLAIGRATKSGGSQ